MCCVCACVCLCVCVSANPLVPPCGGVPQLPCMRAQACLARMHRQRERCHDLVTLSCCSGGVHVQCTYGARGCNPLHRTPKKYVFFGVSVCVWLCVFVRAPITRIACCGCRLVRLARTPWDPGLDAWRRLVSSAHVGGVVARVVGPHARHILVAPDSADRACSCRLLPFPCGPIVPDMLHYKGL